MFNAADPHRRTACACSSTLMNRWIWDAKANTGVIRDARAREMGVILMRPLTSGVFQRLMAEAFPDIDAVASDGWSRSAAAKTVLSDPYVDVALVGMREPRFVELNNEISDDVASRIDGHEACLSGLARSVRALTGRG